MVRVLHDGWAQVIDGVSFGFINLLQIRARAGGVSLEECKEYFERCENQTLEEFYQIPNGAEFELPEEGSFRATCPHLSGCEENDHVHLDIWLGPKGWKSPTMFLLHGVMSVSDVGYRMWAKKLNKLGWSAIFFHLPYHYGRKPENALSGEMALTSNVIRTTEGIRQSVIELRLICKLLKEKGCPHIGLWATSYGGWVSGILIQLETIISTAWLLEPIVDVDHAVWESPATITLRRQLKKRGIKREFIRQHLKKFSPWHGEYPVIPVERILLVAGLFDRIAPADSIKALSEKWKGSSYAEFRQGHVGYQLMPESLKLAQKKFPDLFE